MEAGAYCTAAAAAEPPPAAAEEPPATMVQSIMQPAGSTAGYLPCSAPVSCSAPAAVAFQHVATVCVPAATYCGHVHHCVAPASIWLAAAAAALPAAQSRARPASALAQQQPRAICSKAQNPT